VHRTRALLTIVVLVAAVASAACSTTAGDGSGTGGTPVPAATTPAAEHLGVAYATASPTQVLDLWVPEATGPVPLVIYVHGGAWQAGDRTEVATKRAALLDAGFAVASVDYRLSGEATWPAQIQDVKAAVRHLRADADAYGLDPDRFAAWGSSAGGHLVAVLGATGGRTTDLDDLSLGEPDTSSAVQAVVAWYPPVDLDRMQSMADAGTPCDPRFDHSSASSPESRLLGDLVGSIPEQVDSADPTWWLTTAEPGSVPPFSIAHGDADCIVPVEQSQLLADALTDAGVPVALTIEPGWIHVDARFDAELRAPTIAWLREVLGS
jgi:acetyl esterase/lipase